MARKNTIARNHLTAEWNKSQGRYHLVGTTFQANSVDGDQWYRENGEAEESPEFCKATVLLSGGPRDGYIVS